MDWHVVLAGPVEEVFACFADPSRLGDWLVGYRFFIGAQTLTLRMTCTVQAGQTQLHVRQSGDAAPLALDFSHAAGGTPPSALSTPSPRTESTAEQGETQCGT